MKHAALSLLLASVTAAGAPPDATVKEQFSRGVRLFDAESYAQALTQFEEVYARTQAPAVLFNLAMTHAQLGQPVEAVARFDALIAAPGSLPVERVARAKQLREEQAARIAHVKLTTDVQEPLLVEVDGRSRPVASGEEIALNPGQRFLTVLAQGHLPWREAMTLTPGATQTLEPTLLRSTLSPAQVRIVCPISDFEVRVDGREVARTPVTTAIGLSPGKHELSLSREGYRPLSVAIELAEGARETLRFEPQVDLSSTGTLQVHVSENQAVIAVDGQPAGVTGAIEVPHGRHVLLVRRDGFFPVEREVQVPRGEVLGVHVRLEPTPELRGQLQKSADQHRLWGITGVAAGVATVAGGVAIVAVNRGPYLEAEREFDAALMGWRSTMSGAAADRLAAAGPVVSEKEAIQVAGLVTLGIGALMAGAGGFALFTAPDPNRYDAAPRNDALAPLSSLQVGVGPNALTISGRF